MERQTGAAQRHPAIGPGFQEAPLRKLWRCQDFVEMAQRRDRELEFVGNGRDLGLGAAAQPRQDQRVHLFGVLLTHGAQLGVARLLGPSGRAHCLHEAFPLRAGAAGQANVAILAGQDHERIGAPGIGGAAAGAGPLHAVMDVEPAIHRDIGSEHVGQRDIDDLAPLSRQARLPRGKAGSGQVGAGLAFQYAGWQG